MGKWNFEQKHTKDTEKGISPKKMPRIVTPQVNKFGVPSGSLCDLRDLLFKFIAVFRFKCYRSKIQ